MNADDEELMSALRTLWRSVDPEPAGLIERMVAAVAADDISREYELLTLVEDAATNVRGDAETTILQFSDGRFTVLLNISTAAKGRRRMDGWVDAPAATVVLEHGDRSWSTQPTEHGRFAFDTVPSGLCRVRVTLTDDDDGREFATPHFEV